MDLIKQINDVGFKGVFSISKGSDIVKQSAYGYADKKNNQLNNLNTVFRIASVTKQFTAITILKLYEEGKIDLFDTIDKYIDNVTRNNEITIHHLLSNSSGIQNFSLDTDFDKVIDDSNVLESVINLIREKPLMFNPGEKFFYSISGYLILQYIIEKVSGLTYNEYLKQSFFNRLNMKSTGLETPFTVIPNKAIPYKDINQPAKHFDMRIAGGGGGLYSSLSDLRNWFEALINNRILLTESHNLMFQKHIKADEHNSYGYGMIIAQKDNYLRYYHPGGGMGVNSFIAYFPKSEYSYIMLSNYEEKESFNKARKLIEEYIEDH